MSHNITTKIAGIFNYPEGKGALKLLATGQSMIAQREPANPHDPNAIAVFANSATGPVKIGYLPKVLAAQLKEHEILGVYKGVAWDEIKVDVSDNFVTSSR